MNIRVHSKIVMVLVVLLAAGLAGCGGGKSSEWIATVPGPASTAPGTAPTVTALTPTSGPVAGGTSVTITGTGFTGATSVIFGTTPAAAFTVASATQITATSPAHAVGAVDVSVTTSGGTSVATAADQYTYVAAPTVTGLSPARANVAGGVRVTITGTALTGATAVGFGANPGTAVTVLSDTQVTAVCPAGAAGTVDVTVKTLGGTSATVAADRFSYGLGRMYVVNVSPNTITSYANPSQVDGNVAPTTTATAGMSGSRQMVVDTVRNRLYVTNLNNNTVSIYDSADALNGATAPTAVLTGFSTLYAVAVDEAGDRLFVGDDTGTGQIWVFDQASTLTGGVATPSRTVTQMGSGVVSLAVDPTGNRLFAAVPNAIDIFDNASTMTGTRAATVSRTVTGAATGLSLFPSLFLDPASQRLYAGNNAEQNVLVYNNAGTMTGNQAPVATLAGAATLLGTPAGVWVDTVRNELYVANQDSTVTIYANASTVTGNTAPVRRLSGGATGLNVCYGMWIDPTR